MQRRLINTLRFFTLSHKLLKVAVVKSFSSGLYFIATACFDEYFLFHVITGRRYFYLFLILPYSQTAPNCS